MTDTARDRRRAQAHQLLRLARGPNPLADIEQWLIAERDTLARRVAAVKTLCDEWPVNLTRGRSISLDEYGAARLLADFRAALADTGGDDRGPEDRP